MNKEKSDYSNQIPQTLLRRVIRSTTDVGDLVVDPFAGTFSTVKAALATGRLGWGCDMNQQTKQYWPQDSDFLSSYEEEDFSFDVGNDFDLVRANMNKSQFGQLLVRALENSDFSDRKKELILRELELISEN